MTTIALAVLTGIAVLLAGNLPWVALLAPLNLRVARVAPWAVPPMAIYLWCYWKYIGGSWGSKATSAKRQTNLRANLLSAEVWGASLAAGLLGFIAIGAMLVLMVRLVKLPDSAPLTLPAGMPSITAFVLLVMSSVVAGVTEEAAFRGYMQGPVERRYGVALAILVNGTAFGLLHFRNHPADVWIMLPYYIAVSAAYGGLTWASNSILPALVLHSGGDVWSLGRLWLTGRPEWQLSPAPAKLIWETGIDAGFLLSAAAFVVFVGLTWWAYVGVHSLTRTPLTTAVGRAHSELDAQSSPRPWSGRQ
jgi:membrane protease YdiL (CAAX protease family)